jgi:hypothetical protein
MTYHTKRAADQILETLKLVYAQLQQRSDALNGILRETVAQLTPLPASSAIIIALFAAFKPGHRLAEGWIIAGLALFIGILTFSAWLATIGLRRLKVRRVHESDIEVPIETVFRFSGYQTEQTIMGPKGENLITRDLDEVNYTEVAENLAEAADLLAPHDNDAPDVWLRKSIALERIKISQLESSVDRAKRLLLKVQVLLGVQVAYLVVLVAYAPR